MNPHRALVLLLALLGVVVALALPAPTVQAGGVIRVKPAGGLESVGCGTSWGNACTLPYALTTAAVAGTELWVAAGTYKPTPGTTRSATFQLKNGVKLYGGFAGTETLRTQRDAAVYVTTLSGEIGGAGNSDNVYHVVTAGSGITTQTVLDGFTVTGGNADAAAGPDNYGGGLYNAGGNPTLNNVTFSHNSAITGGGMYNDDSGPVLTNVIFSANWAVEGGGMANTGSSPTLANVTFGYNDATHGGGMYNSSSNPTLNHATFSGNQALGFGGGMYNAGNSSPALTDVAFSDNDAKDYGGGMFNVNNSDPTLTGVTFSGNTAEAGGGMFNDSSGPELENVTFSLNKAFLLNGGGMFNYNSSPTLTSVTFSGNEATYGGGMCNLFGSNPVLTNVTFSGNEAGYGGGINNGSSSPRLTNVTFHGNTAHEAGGGMRNAESSNPVVRNSIFWGNTAQSDLQLTNIFGGTLTIYTSVVQGGCPALSTTCTGLIEDDPLLGALGDWGGATQTIPLLPGSPAIDAGEAAFCPQTDQRGVARPQGAGCDLGAYEVPYLFMPLLARH